MVGLRLKRCRTCDGCRALYRRTYGGFSCEFRFSIDTHERTISPGFIIRTPVPAEPCPKPISLRQYGDALDEYGLGGQKRTKTQGA